MDATETVDTRAIRVLSTSFIHTPGMFRNLEHCVKTGTQLVWAKDMFEAMVGVAYADLFDTVFPGNWKADGDAVIFFAPAEESV